MLISQITNRLFNRTPLFLLTIVGFIVWFFVGKEALTRFFSPKDTIKEYVEGQIKQIEAMDPAAGAKLAAMARERDIRVLAASLKIQDQRAGGSGARAILAELARPDNGDLSWYDISHIGMRDGSFSTANERLEFAQGHGWAYQSMLDIDESGRLAAEYAKNPVVTIVAPAERSPMLAE